MNTTRRLLLKAAGSAGLIAAAIAAGLLKPGQALADWDSAAFSATSLSDALGAIGASSATTSLDLELKTPGIVENGAAVPVDVVTTLPDVEYIAILAENAPTALVAQYTLTDFGGMLSTRIKMRENAIKVHAIAKSSGRLYATVKEFKMTVGGYGV
jgi:sulfur-oxidizing protein SoxY